VTLEHSYIQLADTLQEIADKEAKCRNCYLNTDKSNEKEDSYCLTQCPIGLKLQKLGAEYQEIRKQINEIEGKPEVDDKGVVKSEFIKMVNNKVKKAKIARHFDIDRATVYNRIKQWQDEILV